VVREGEKGRSRTASTGGTTASVVPSMARSFEALRAPERERMVLGRSAEVEVGNEALGGA